MQYHVITIGNAVIDAFLSFPSTSNDLTLDTDNKKLCIPYGEKVLLEECQFVLGGNACNVAVGISRLGYSSALIAELGSDEFAQKILNGLRKENVGTDLLLRGIGQSSFSIGINFQGERTLFTEHREREHDFLIQSLNPTYFYVTSLGNKWEHVYRSVEEKIKSSTGTRLAFNPGSLQIKTGLTSFEYLLPLTDILFLNKDEGNRLLGKESEVESILQAFQQKGVRTVVITDGEKGSWCLDPEGKIHRQEIITCDVVERTGAGDAFATGFLAAIISGKEQAEALMWGAKNAASVIGKIGSQEGLLRKDQL